MGTVPTFELELQYWEQGVGLVAGLDEAGMGAWAGPVCAGAVVFSAGKFSIGNFQFSLNDQFSNDSIVIRDSKTLSVEQRERAAEAIKDRAVAWAVGEASVEEISGLNIRAASHLAMRRAIEGLGQLPELLLIDGTPAQVHEEIPTVNVVDGDATCVSIAAASILAKVHRDALMVELDRQYPEYGLAQHKGYGTAAHKAALHELGPSVCHRPTYAPVAAALARDHDHRLSP